MADLGIGAHCALERCNVNDFLPIRCKCDKLFCGDHIAPDVHACTVLASATPIPANGTDAEKEKMQRCAAKGCAKLSLEAFVAPGQAEAGRVAALCPRCRQAFCSTHRVPGSHACTAPDPSGPAPRNEAGKALLAKLFPPKDSPASSTASTATSQSPSSSPSSPPQPTTVPKKPPTNPKKAAQLRKVALMKMRHQAQPGDPRDKTRSVPVDQRLHVKVRVRDAAGNMEKESVFWFLPTMGTGRALDLLATHLGVSSDSAPLYLDFVPPENPEEETRLRNDIPLSDQVPDGGQLFLSR